MTKSIFTTMKAFKKVKDTHKSFQILTESRHPDFLVPIAFETLKSSLHKINVRHLEMKGMRKKYIVELLILKHETFLFCTGDYLEDLIKFYTTNSINSFIMSHIVEYTRINLSKETLFGFIALWSLMPTDLVGRYFEGISVGEIERQLIEKVCVPDPLYVRFYISNDLFPPFCVFDPLYQVYQVVRFLKSEDILEKMEILSRGIHMAFKAIVMCNLEIYDIKPEIRFISKNIKFGKIDLTKDNISLIYSRYELSNYDNLDIRKIHYFFRTKEVSEKWHRYFIADTTVDSYDDHLILFKLFNIRNYDCIFDKNDCMLIENNISKNRYVGDTKILDLYCLSLKNPTFKGLLKQEIEQTVLKYEKFSIKESESTLIMEKDILKTFLYEILKTVGALFFTQLFDKHLEKDQSTFLAVFLYYLKNEQIQVEHYKEFFKRMLSKKIENNTETSLSGSLSKMSLDEDKYISDRITISCLFEILSYSDFYDFNLYIKNVNLFNPEILLRSDIDLVISNYGNIKSTVCGLIEARKISLAVLNDQECVVKTQRLLGLEQSKNEKYVFTDGYLRLIIDAFSFSVKNDNIMSKTRKTVDVDMKDVINHDSFIMSLLFENKSLHNLTNTFYLSKDLEAKFYMPKFWKAYFKRNKIENLETFLISAKTQINTMHMINIITSLYCEENKSTCFRFVENVKNTSQEILFFKLLFIFYNYRSKDAKFKQLFNALSPLATSNDCKSIVNILMSLYGQSQQVESINKLATDIKEETPNPEYPNLPFIFSKKSIDKAQFTVFEYSRKCEELLEFDYCDKSGTMKMLFQELKGDPSFILRLFAGMDVIETLDWSILKDFICKEYFMDEIICLVQKHRSIYNQKEVYEALKQSKEFYSHKIINTLPHDEIVKLASDKNFTNITFYKNLSHVNLFPILEHDFEYKENHYEILNEYVRLSEFTVAKGKSHKMQENMFYCMLARLNGDKNIKLFIQSLESLSDVPQVPFDHRVLQQEEIINMLVNAYLTKMDEKIMKVLKMILGGVNYFMPMYVERFPYLKNLLKFKLYD